MNVSVLDLASGTASIACGNVPTGGLTTLTVEGWWRILSFSAVNRPLLGKYGAGKEWLLYATRDGRLFCALWTVNGVALAYSAPGALRYGVWTHVAGCYSPTGPRVRVNGADVTAVARHPGGALVTTTQIVRIGGSLSETGCVGRVGWQRISTALRTACRGPADPPAVDGNTLAQWQMDAGSGATVDNAQGNAAYDGVITAATWATSSVSDKSRARPPVAPWFGRRGAAGPTVGVGQHG